MDNLRVFSTFNSHKKTVAKSGRRRRLPSEDGRADMQKRDLSEKPSVSNSEIREKLEKNKAGKFKRRSVKGKKMGDGFMADQATSETEGKTPSDVGLNDPNDPMTSEKLKSVLNAGVVNFSGREKEILAKILNN